MIIRNVTVVLPDRLVPNSHLRVADGVIQAVGGVGGEGDSAAEKALDGRGAYLTPGFIDLHVHGAMGRDAMEASPEAFEVILRHHATGGTTALALTTVTARLEDLRRVLAAARKWKTSSRPGTAALLGIHLEGPYFAASKAGAHRVDSLRIPCAADTHLLMQDADLITQVTLAPELDGAPELIAELRSRNIIASGGHSDAWDDEALRAFEQGMNHVTHVYNAMSSARRRGAYRVAGLLEFALAEPGIRCELIADNQHVSPTLMRLAYRAKGADGICLVSDASPGTGLPDGSAYRLGELDCTVSGEAGFTNNGATLAGSTTTLIDGVRNLVRRAGVPLVEAVRMASLTPARALGVANAKGSLEAGKDADFVLLSPSLEIRATYVAGQCIYGNATMPPTVQ